MWNPRISIGACPKSSDDRVFRLEFGDSVGHHSPACALPASASLPAPDLASRNLLNHVRHGHLAVSDVAVDVADLQSLSRQVVANVVDDAMAGEFSDQEVALGVRVVIRGVGDLKAELGQ